MASSDINNPAHAKRRDEIVVAVDGSDGSRAALRWAGAAAVALGAPLRCVQAWEYPPTLLFPWSESSPKSAEQVDASVRDDIAKIVAEELPGTEPALEALRGPAGSALVSLAETVPCRMLVVGSRGRGGFAGLLLGSVSRQCVEYAPTTVVVVPDSKRSKVTTTLTSILVGIDGSGASDDALTFALTLGADANTPVIAAHCFAPAFAEIPVDVVAELRTAVKAALNDQWTADLPDGTTLADRVLADGDARHVLAEIAEERGADLLVVGDRGTGTLKKLLGPVATHLVTHAQIPTAVVR